MVNKLAASVEVLSASILGNLNDADLKEFTADPQATMKAKVNADTSAFDIKIVENSTNEINLSLPYYDFVGSSQAKEMKEEDLDAVAGGEIFILAAIGLIATVAVTGAATAAVIAGPPAAVAVGIAAGVKASEGKNLDDSKK